MPYYCTVPQCTSMAGKAKNVSFHQFPRDQELAKLWNHILKRGKPYTKYSKVCSLHFRPEDYTITSVGKNKGQWRTLRKDAVPSRNLPSDSPAPAQRRRSSANWLPNTAAVDHRVQMQMAQAIYMKTMMSMQNATPITDAIHQSLSEPTPTSNHVDLSDALALLIQRNTENTMFSEKTSYKCTECSKCFKDPDVFVLHRRLHGKERVEANSEVNSISVSNTNNIVEGNKTQSKEGSSVGHNATLNDIENILQSRGTEITDGARQETLKANPILANLLRSGIPNGEGNGMDVNNILSIENQIMAALAASMESYIRNLSSLLAEAKTKEGSENSEQNDELDQNSDHDDDTSLKIKTEDTDSEQNDKNSDNELNGHSSEHIGQIDTNGIKTEQMDCSFDHDQINNTQTILENNPEQNGNADVGATCSLRDRIIKNENESTENDINCMESKNFLTPTDLSFESRLEIPPYKQNCIPDFNTKSPPETMIDLEPNLGIKSQNNATENQNFEQNYLHFINNERNSSKSRPTVRNHKKILQKNHHNSIQNVENDLSTDINDQNCMNNKNTESNNQKLDKNVQTLLSYDTNFEQNAVNDNRFDKNGQHCMENEISSTKEGSNEPVCDNEDLNQSRDSDMLVIDDSVL